MPPLPQTSILQASSTSRTHPAIKTLHRWHLLSLDAPTVATLWTWFVAHTVSLALPARSLCAVFVAVWMLYAADRLLDARPLFANPLQTDGLELRHLFHYQHSTAFLTGVVAASITLAALLRHLSPEALELYTILGVLLFSWFLLIHTRAAGGHRRLPKELAVGIFFSAAVFIPTIARAPGLRPALLPCALLFAGVCSLNCLGIYAWEHAASPIRSHWTTSLGTAHLYLSGSTLALLGVLMAIRARNTTLWPLPAAASLSVFLLLALHSQRGRFSVITLRSVADLALLTPLLIFAAGFVE